MGGAQESLFLTSSPGNSFAAGSVKKWYLGMEAGITLYSQLLPMGALLLQLDFKVLKDMNNT